ncbi:dihydroxyacetone kinase subunit DhaL [Marinivivus vitaminiproducens]|uniref:dihydroxyacetone kinase subunit DhaL n=1 Tax=Marinivivus vitaminiproducens TaxID=3035935 RepID=UPI00279AFAAE|nr:dihydroxyacetone kinase subunit DhaL [Geminicoccaceae bacterium SCSIO 64248]
MDITPELLGRLIDRSASAVQAHASHLTRLDQAIGDGDHGSNLARGFVDLSARQGELTSLPLGEALRKMGMALVMKVGGASGPLYGTLLIEMGKAAPEGRAVTLSDLAHMVEQGVAGLKRRGKSDRGQKTMLDVLCPVADEIAFAATAGDVDDLPSRVREAAADGLEATRPMQATRGRASYLGERSIDHLDPGAASSQLLIEAVIAVLEEAP